MPATRVALLAAAVFLAGCSTTVPSSIDLGASDESAPAAESEAQPTSPVADELDEDAALAFVDETTTTTAADTTTTEAPATDDESADTEESEIDDSEEIPEIDESLGVPELTSVVFGDGFGNIVRPSATEAELGQQMLDELNALETRWADTEIYIAEPVETSGDVSFTRTYSTTVWHPVGESDSPTGAFTISTDVNVVPEIVGPNGDILDPDIINECFQWDNCSDGITRDNVTFREVTTLGQTTVQRCTGSTSDTANATTSLNCK